MSEYMTTLAPEFDILFPGSSHSRREARRRSIKQATIFHDALTYDRLEDRHHLRGMCLDDRPVLFNGCGYLVVHAYFLDQFRLVVVVNGG
jgi:hypothetical protein